MSTLLTIGHRGALRDAPENTLPAIERAKEAGVEMIALDLQGTKDHELVVFADTKLDRTTNGTGRIAQQTLKELRLLDAGSWFGSKFAGTRIPTLAEALKAVGAKHRLMLGVSEMRAGTPLAAALLEGLKGRSKPNEDVLVFPDSDSLKAFREKAPDFGYALALGERVEGWVHLEKASRLGLKTVRPHRHQIQSALVRDAHAKNLQVFAYFADEESEMRELMSAHVDGIVTGRPELLKKVQKETQAA